MHSTVAKTGKKILSAYLRMHAVLLAYLDICFLHFRYPPSSINKAETLFRLDLMRKWQFASSVSIKHSYR